MHTSHNLWWTDSQFYHIYPLGFCGAPAENPAPGTPYPDAGDGAPDTAPAGAGAHGAAPVERLNLVTEHLPTIAAQGCNALYLGPLFESGSHGYDTADYFTVDRRLGTNETLTRLVTSAHDLGIRVVLDGVFNHVGRDFRAFRELRATGTDSLYREWFRGVDFSRNNGFDDGFVYEGWEGTDTLISLNLDNRNVREHLFEAVRHMRRSFGIDGLRLDVAYLLPHDFLEELRRVTDDLGAGAGGEFRLMGEMIHGDYAALTAPGRLHSVTNYECYKGLWSSHNDRNYFEIAHSLDRLFGDGGLLTRSDRPGENGGDAATGSGSGAGAGAPVPTYNFADNHDVDRVMTSLADADHVFPLYALLWTMPGVPSVYYGSEWLISGSKAEGDAALRPAWHEVPKDDHRLVRFLGELSRIRRESPAIRRGTYRQLHVSNETFAFAREAGEETVVVAVNASEEAVTLPVKGEAVYIDLFAGAQVPAGKGIPVPAKGAAVLRAE